MNNGNSSMQAMQPATAGYWTATKHLPCPFEGCDKKFTCNHNVLQHVREAHTGERPHECHLCAEKGRFAAFSRPASLYRHQRGVHNYEPRVGPRGRPRGPRGPRAKKSIGRNDAPVSAAPALPNDQTYIDPHIPQQPPQPAGANSIICFNCGMSLTSQDDWLVHGHIAHGDPYNQFCNCSICAGSFAQAKVIANSIQEKSNNVAIQPPATGQAATIQQPEPLRTLDLNFLSTLDDRLKRVQATQNSDADMIGVESSCTPETETSNGADGMGGVESSSVSAEVRSDSAIDFDQAFDQGDFHDYAEPFHFSRSLEDFLNNLPNDGSGADVHLFN